MTGIRMSDFSTTDMRSVVLPLSFVFPLYFSRIVEVPHRTFKTELKDGSKVTGFEPEYRYVSMFLLYIEAGTRVDLSFAKTMDSSVSFIHTPLCVDRDGVSSITVHRS